MRLRKRKNTVERDNNIIKGYKDGLSLVSIGVKYGLNPSSVWYILTRIYKIKTRSRGHPTGEKNPKRIFTDIEECLICKEYLDGATLKIVGDRRKVGLGLISQILKRNNIQTRLTKATGKVGKYCSLYKHGLYNTKEYMKFHKAKRRAYGEVSISDIQQVYEDNIKQYGTLTCYLCIKPIEFGNDHLEHKTPVTRGGSNNKDNLAIACSKCNLRKNIKTEEEYRQYLTKGAICLKV